MTNWKKVLLYASMPITFWLAYRAITSLAEDFASIDFDDLYKTEDDDGWC